MLVDNPLKRVQVDCLMAFCHSRIAGIAGINEKGTVIFNNDDVMNVTDPISGITFQIALYRQYRQVRYEVGLAWGVSSVKPAHGCLILG